MLRFATMLVAVILCSSPAPGQSSQPSSSSTQPTSSLQSSLGDETEESALEDERTWAFSATAFWYAVPDERNYAAATFTADWDWLHLEARYNYEDIDTGSLWAGVNFSFGEELTLDITPMFGVVFGNTDGIAPGYEITLTWRQFELYTEGEYVFDLHDSDDNFFYSWSELSFYPVEWLRFGLVAQRTKAYATDLDTQAGFLVGFSYERVDLTSYVFNPGSDDLTFVFALTLNF